MDNHSRQPGDCKRYLLRDGGIASALNMTDEIDQALLAVLGDSDDGGIDPVRVEQRINSLPVSIRPKIQSYIDRTIGIPLPNNLTDLTCIGDAILNKLEEEMPELSRTARMKLSNYYTYQWR